MNDDTHRVLKEAANEFEATAIVERLQLEGIDAMAAGEIGGGQPLSGPSRCPVLVPAADLERARQLLDDWAAAAGEDDDEPFRRRMPTPARIAFTVAVVLAILSVIAVVAWLVP